ncbi:hypothetical protein EUTSA_v10016022mg, partial [Eutrema salsugineum]
FSLFRTPISLSLYLLTPCRSPAKFSTGNNFREVTGITRDNEIQFNQRRFWINWVWHWSEDYPTLELTGLGEKYLRMCVVIALIYLKFDGKNKETLLEQQSESVSGYWDKSFPI